MSCSPDGLIYTGDDDIPEGILEVKCPYRFRFKKDMSKYDYLKLDYMNPDLYIRTDHKFYHRAQAEMYATHTAWCDFVIWSPGDILITRIYSDPNWVETKVHLIDYAFNHYLIGGSSKGDEIKERWRLKAQHSRRARAPEMGQDMDDRKKRKLHE